MRIGKSFNFLFVKFNLKNVQLENCALLQTSINRLDFLIVLFTFFFFIKSQLFQSFHGFLFVDNLRKQDYSVENLLIHLRL